MAAIADLTALLLSSEEQYLTLLSGLLESYATPIAAAHSKNATAAALVTSLQGLIASNTDLLAGMNAGAATGQLCQVFCDRIGGALTLHVQYAERFHDFATMLEASVDPAFMHRIDGDPVTARLCRGLALDELLTAPLDRVVMYLNIFQHLTRALAEIASPDAQYGLAAVTGLTQVAAMITNSEAAGNVAVLSRGLGVSLQHHTSRVFVREGGFDVALLVYPPGTHPLPSPSPATGTVSDASSQPLPAKSIVPRQACHVWLFSDSLMIARITREGAYRFHAVVPLTGGCTVSKHAVEADAATAGAGRLHDHVTTLTSPTGVLDPVIVAAAMPPLCNDLSVATGPTALAKGEVFALQLWPRSAAEAAEVASAGETSDPEDDARAVEKLNVWTDDLSAVVQGAMGDPMLPRVRSIAAREKSLAAYAANPEAAIAAAAAAGGSSPSHGTGSGSGAAVGGAGGAGGGAAGDAGGGLSGLTTDGDVIRAIADVKKLPVGVYDSASFADEAQLRAMYQRVVDAAVGITVLMEGRLERRGGLTGGNKSRYVIARVTRTTEERVEGEFESYESAADAAKGTGKGKDSYSLASFTSATYLNDAGSDKSRGMFELQFEETKIRYKADTDEEAQQWVLMLWCLDELNRRMTKASFMWEAVKQQRARQASSQSASHFIAASVAQAPEVKRAAKPTVADSGKKKLRSFRGMLASVSSSNLAITTDVSPTQSPGAASSPHAATATSTSPSAAGAGGPTAEGFVPAGDAVSAAGSDSRASPGASTPGLLGTPARADRSASPSASSAGAPAPASASSASPGASGGASAGGGQRFFSKFLKAAQQTLGSIGSTITGSPLASGASPAASATPPIDGVMAGGAAGSTPLGAVAGSLATPPRSDEAGGASADAAAGVAADGTASSALLQGSKDGSSRSLRAQSNRTLLQTLPEDVTGIDPELAALPPGLGGPSPTEDTPGSGDAPGVPDIGAAVPGKRGSLGGGIAAPTAATDARSRLLASAAGGGSNRSMGSTGSAASSSGGGSTSLLGMAAGRGAPAVPLAPARPGASSLLSVASQGGSNRSVGGFGGLTPRDRTADATTATRQTQSPTAATGGTPRGWRDGAAAPSTPKSARGGAASSLVDVTAADVARNASSPPPASAGIGGSSSPSGLRSQSLRDTLLRVSGAPSTPMAPRQAAQAAAGAGPGSVASGAATTTVAPPPLAAFASAAHSSTGATDGATATTGDGASRRASGGSSAPTGLASPLRSSSAKAVAGAVGAGARASMTRYVGGIRMSITAVPTVEDSSRAPVDAPTRQAGPRAGTAQARFAARLGAMPLSIVTRSSLLPKRLSVYDLAARLDYGVGAGTPGMGPVPPGAPRGGPAAAYAPSFFRRQSVATPVAPAPIAPAPAPAPASAAAPAAAEPTPSTASGDGGRAFTFATHVVPRKRGDPTPRGSIAVGAHLEALMAGEASVAPAPSAAGPGPAPGSASGKLVTMSPAAASVALSPTVLPQHLMLAVVASGAADRERLARLEAEHRHRLYGRNASLAAASGLRLTLDGIPPSILSDLEAEARAIQAASTAAQPALVDSPTAPNAQWLRTLTPAAAVALARHGGAAACETLLQLYASRAQYRLAGEALFFIRHAGIALSPRAYASYIEALTRAARYVDAEDAFAALPATVLAQDAAEGGVIGLALVDGLARGGCYRQLHALLTAWAAAHTRYRVAALGSERGSASLPCAPAPAVGHWNALIVAAGVAGNVDLAVALARAWLLCWLPLQHLEDRDDAMVAARQLNMAFPLPPDVTTLHALIVACAHGGDVLRSRLLFEVLVDGDSMHDRALSLFIPSSVVGPDAATAPTPGGEDPITLAFVRESVLLTRGVYARGDLATLQRAFGSPSTPAEGSRAASYVRSATGRRPGGGDAAHDAGSALAAAISGGGGGGGGGTLSSLANTGDPAFAALSPPLSRSVLVTQLLEVPVRRWSVYDAVAVACEVGLARTSVDGVASAAASSAGSGSSTPTGTASSVGGSSSLFPGPSSYAPRQPVTAAEGFLAGDDAVAAAASAFGQLHKLRANAGSYHALMHAYALPSCAAPEAIRAVLAVFQARCALERASVSSAPSSAGASRSASGATTPSSGGYRFRTSASGPANVYVGAGATGGGGGGSGSGAGDGSAAVRVAALRNEWSVTPATFDLLIEAYANSGDMAAVRATLDAMGRAGVAVTPGTYRHLLCALGYAGRFEEARALFEVQQDSDAADDDSSYAAMMAALIDSSARTALRVLLHSGADMPNPRGRVVATDEAAAAAAATVAARRDELVARCQAVWALLYDMTSSAIELIPTADTYQAAMEVLSTLSLLSEHGGDVENDASDGGGTIAEAEVAGVLGPATARGAGNVARAYRLGWDVAAVQPVVRHMLAHDVAPSPSLMHWLCAQANAGGRYRQAAFLPLIQQLWRGSGGSSAASQIASSAAAASSPASLAASPWISHVHVAAAFVQLLAGAHGVNAVPPPSASGVGAGGGGAADPLAALSADAASAHLRQLSLPGAAAHAGFSDSASLAFEPLERRSASAPPSPRHTATAATTFVLPSHARLGEAERVLVALTEAASTAAAVTPGSSSGGGGSSGGAAGLLASQHAVVDVAAAYTAVAAAHARVVGHREHVAAALAAFATDCNVTATMESLDRDPHGGDAVCELSEGRAIEQVAMWTRQDTIVAGGGVAGCGLLPAESANSSWRLHPRIGGALKTRRIVARVAALLLQAHGHHIAACFLALAMGAAAPPSGSEAGKAAALVPAAALSAGVAALAQFVQAVTSGATAAACETLRAVMREDLTADVRSSAAQSSALPLVMRLWRATPTATALAEHAAYRCLTQPLEAVLRGVASLRCASANLALSVIAAVETALARLSAPPTVFLAATALQLLLASQCGHECEALLCRWRALAVRSAAATPGPVAMSRKDGAAPSPSPTTAPAEPTSAAAAAAYADALLTHPDIVSLRLQGAAAAGLGPRVSAVWQQYRGAVAGNMAAMRAALQREADSAPDDVDASLLEFLRRRLLAVEQCIPPSLLQCYVTSLVRVTASAAIGDSSAAATARPSVAPPGHSVTVAEAPDGDGSALGLGVMSAPMILADAATQQRRHAALAGADGAADYGEYAPLLASRSLSPHGGHGRRARPRLSLGTVLTAVALPHAVTMTPTAAAAASAATSFRSISATLAGDGGARSTKSAAARPGASADDLPLPTSQQVPGVARVELLSAPLTLQTLRETVCACCSAGVPVTTAMLCTLIQAYVACGLRSDARLLSRLLLSAVTGIELTASAWLADVAADSQRLFSLLHSSLQQRARVGAGATTAAALPPMQFRADVDVTAADASFVRLFSLDADGTAFRPRESAPAAVGARDGSVRAGSGTASRRASTSDSVTAAVVALDASERAAASVREVYADALLEAFITGTVYPAPSPVNLAAFGLGRRGATPAAGAAGGVRGVTAPLALTATTLAQLVLAFGASGVDAREIDGLLGYAYDVQSAVAQAAEGAGSSAVRLILLDARAAAAVHAAYTLLEEPDMAESVLTDGRFVWASSPGHGGEAAIGGGGEGAEINTVVAAADPVAAAGLQWLWSSLQLSAAGALPSQADGGAGAPAAAAVRTINTLRIHRLVAHGDVHGALRLLELHTANLRQRAAATGPDSYEGTVWWSVEPTALTAVLQAASSLTAVQLLRDPPADAPITGAQAPYRAALSLLGEDPDAAPGDAAGPHSAGRGAGLFASAGPAAPPMAAGAADGFDAAKMSRRCVLSRLLAVVEAAAAPWQGAAAGSATAAASSWQPTLTDVEALSLLCCRVGWQDAAAALLWAAVDVATAADGAAPSAAAPADADVFAGSAVLTGRTVAQLASASLAPPAAASPSPHDAIEAARDAIVAALSDSVLAQAATAQALAMVSAASGSAAASHLDGEAAESLLRQLDSNASTLRGHVRNKALRGMGRYETMVSVLPETGQRAAAARAPPTPPSTHHSAVATCLRALTALPKWQGSLPISITTLHRLLLAYATAPAAAFARAAITSTATTALIATFHRCGCPLDALALSLVRVLVYRIATAGGWPSPRTLSGADSATSALFARADGPTYRGVQPMDVSWLSEWSADGIALALRGVPALARQLGLPRTAGIGAGPFGAASVFPDFSQPAPSLASAASDATDYGFDPTPTLITLAATSAADTVDDVLGAAVDGGSGYGGTATAASSYVSAAQAYVRSTSAAPASGSAATAIPSLTPAAVLRVAKRAGVAFGLTSTISAGGWYRDIVLAPLAAGPGGGEGIRGNGGGGMRLPRTWAQIQARRLPVAATGTRTGTDTGNASTALVSADTRALIEDAFVAVTVPACLPVPPSQRLPAAIVVSALNSVGFAAPPTYRLRGPDCTSLLIAATLHRLQQLPPRPQPAVPRHVEAIAAAAAARGLHGVSAADLSVALVGAGLPYRIALSDGEPAAAATDRGSQAQALALTAAMQAPSSSDAPLAAPASSALLAGAGLSAISPTPSRRGGGASRGTTTPNSSLEDGSSSAAIAAATRRVQCEMAVLQLELDDTDASARDAVREVRRVQADDGLLLPPHTAAQLAAAERELAAAIAPSGLTFALPGAAAAEPTPSSDGISGAAANVEAAMQLIRGLALTYAPSPQQAWRDARSPETVAAADVALSRGALPPSSLRDATSTAITTTTSSAAAAARISRRQQLQTALAELQSQEAELMNRVGVSPAASAAYLRYLGSLKGLMAEESAKREQLTVASKASSLLEQRLEALAAQLVANEAALAEEMATAVAEEATASAAVAATDFAGAAVAGRTLRPPTARLIAAQAAVAAVKPIVTGPAAVAIVRAQTHRLRFASRETLASSRDAIAARGEASLAGAIAMARHLEADVARVGRWLASSSGVVAALEKGLRESATAERLLAQRVAALHDAAVAIESERAAPPPGSIFAQAGALVHNQRLRAEAASTRAAVDRRVTLTHRLELALQDVRLQGEEALNAAKRAFAREAGEVALDFRRQCNAAEGALKETMAAELQPLYRAAADKLDAQAEKRREVEAALAAVSEELRLSTMAIASLRHAVADHRDHGDAYSRASGVVGGGWLPTGDGSGGKAPAHDGSPGGAGDTLDADVAAAAIDAIADREAAIDLLMEVERLAEAEAFVEGGTLGSLHPAGYLRIADAYAAEAARLKMAWRPGEVDVASLLSARRGGGAAGGGSGEVSDARPPHPLDSTIDAILSNRTSAPPPRSAGRGTSPPRGGTTVPASRTSTAPIATASPRSGTRWFIQTGGEGGGGVGTAAPQSLATAPTGAGVGSGRVSALRTLPPSLVSSDALDRAASAGLRSSDIWAAVLGETDGGGGAAEGPRLAAAVVRSRSRSRSRGRAAAPSNGTGALTSPQWAAALAVPTSSMPRAAAGSYGQSDAPGRRADGAATTASPPPLAAGVSAPTAVRRTQHAGAAR